MTWVRFDDSFYDHPKLTGAGSQAAFLYMQSIGYSSRHLTDGLVSTAVVAALAKRGAIQLARRLIDAGLWEDAPGGYRIHDYLDYNPTKADVLEKRAKAKERMLAMRSQDVHANNERTIEEPAPTSRSAIPDPVPLPAQGETSEVSESGSGGHRARKKRAPLMLDDEGFVQEMVTRYGRFVGGEEGIQDAIKLGLENGTKNGYSDSRAVVRNWLSGDRRVLYGQTQEARERDRTATASTAGASNGQEPGGDPKFRAWGT